MEILDYLRLRDRLDDALSLRDVPEVAQPFLRALVRPDRGVRAVLLYGSCLWPSVRSPSSAPDFIVVVDSLAAWQGSGVARLLGGVLPPTVMRLRDPSHPERYAKLCLVTFAQLEAACGPGARDLHLAGRLSKRVALLWSDGADARARVVAAQASALQTLSRLALSRFPAGGALRLEAFIEQLLGLSYESEVRIAEPGKVKALFAADLEHYRAVGRCLLEAAGAQPVGGIVDGEAYSVPGDAAASPREVERLLARSRRRALYRLPKYLFTYEGWLDYLIGKLVRNGVPVRLGPLERRHPLLFAWPVLYRLARARRVR